MCYKPGQSGHLLPDACVQVERPKAQANRKRQEAAAAAASRPRPALAAADVATATAATTGGSAAAAAAASSDEPAPKRQRRPSASSSGRHGGMSVRTSSRRNGGDQGGRFRCSYCARDVSSTSRIKCAECEDFDLCVHCFSVGVEVFPHKNDHKYRVVEHLGFEVYAEDWSADEEELLLEGLSMYGIGRWDAVSEHIGETNGGKAPERVYAHYKEVYLDGSKNAPLPDLGSRVTKEREEANIANSGHRGGSSKVTKEMAASRLANQELSLGGSVAGFHLKREEFEEEHANDAEKSVGDMEFLPDESTEDVELKLQVLEFYNLKLDERRNRTTFLMRRPELLRVPGEKEAALEAKRTVSEKEMVASLRMFARFQTVDEHQQFLEGLAEENRLRARLRQLQQYKLCGLKTLSEGAKYERVRKEGGSSASGVAAAVAAARGEGDPNAASYLQPKAAARGRTTSRARRRGVDDEFGEISPEARGEDSTAALKEAVAVVEGEDGGTELSVEEKEMCARLGMSVAELGSCKAMVVSEYERLRPLAAAAAVARQGGKTGGAPQVSAAMKLQLERGQIVVSSTWSVDRAGGGGGDAK